MCKSAYIYKYWLWYTNNSIDTNNNWQVLCHLKDHMKQLRGKKSRKRNVFGNDESKTNTVTVVKYIIQIIIHSSWIKKKSTIKHTWIVITIPDLQPVSLIIVDKYEYMEKNITCLATVLTWTFFSNTARQ